METVWMYLQMFPSMLFLASQPFPLYCWISLIIGMTAGVLLLRGRKKVGLMAFFACGVAACFALNWVGKTRADEIGDGAIIYGLMVFWVMSALLGCAVGAVGRLILEKSRKLEL